VRLFVLRECQELLKPRLTGPLLNLFAGLTGLPLHVFWHDPTESVSRAASPLVCSAARQKAAAAGRAMPACEECLRDRWGLASQPDGRVRRFQGACGAAILSATVLVDGLRVATLALSGSGQAGDVSDTRSTARPARGEARERAGTRLDRETTAALLMLIVHDVEATAASHLARQESAAAHRRLLNLKTEAAHIVQNLHARLPGLPECQPAPAPGSHAQQIVQAMFDYVNQHYHRPMSLGEVAATLKMNPDYLSHLFSLSVGVTFRHYLDELRLTRAEELLRDPRVRVCEAAAAVGFASADYFRHAFKAHTGCPPSVWRQG